MSNIQLARFLLIGMLHVALMAVHALGGELDAYNDEMEEYKKLLDRLDVLEGGGGK